MKYIAIITTLAGISLGNTLPPTPENTLPPTPEARLGGVGGYPQGKRPRAQGNAPANM